MASRICILGGSGFVGNVLKERLSSNYHVSSPSRLEVDLENLDSLHNYFISQAAFDVVINCAGSVNTDMGYFDYTVFQTNVNIITNLHRCKNDFGRLINFGSGAEFDRSMHIHNAGVWNLDYTMPYDHYGMSKNIGARIVLGNSHWYHLRLFGVFGPTEPGTRLLKRIQQKENIIVVDRPFSYFYVEDIIPVVEYYINESVPEDNDLNLVYPESMRLWDFITLFCQLHSIQNPATLSTKDGLSYTGSGKRLSKLNLPLLGLEEGLRRYQ